MLRRLFQLLVVLIPIGLFALALQPAQKLMFGGFATKGILFFLAALAVLALVEGLLFRYWILPGWSEKMAERLYAGSYLPEEDALAQLIDRIESEKNAALLPRLVESVRQQGWRTRGWLELARLQQELLHDAPAALDSLAEACRAVRDPEDAALLMFRAAQICEKALHDDAAARQWLLRAAAEYPATVYGRKASARLPE